MSEDTRNPQINFSKIPGGSGIAGALFAISSMLIFLVGVPRLRIFFPAAVILGCVVALILRSIRRETPTTARRLGEARCDAGEVDWAAVHCGCTVPCRTSASSRAASNLRGPSPAGALGFVGRAQHRLPLKISHSLQKTGVVAAPDYRRCNIG